MLLWWQYNVVIIVIIIGIVLADVSSPVILGIYRIKCQAQSRNLPKRHLSGETGAPSYVVGGYVQWMQATFKDSLAVSPKDEPDYHMANNSTPGYRPMISERYIHTKTWQAFLVVQW